MQGEMQFGLFIVFTDRLQFQIKIVELSYNRHREQNHQTVLPHKDWERFDGIE